MKNDQFDAAYDLSSAEEGGWREGYYLFSRWTTLSHQAGDKYLVALVYDPKHRLAGL